MEQIITNVVKRVLEKKYPFFTDVEVTKDRVPRSYYIDDWKNYEYNVFLMINKGDYQSLSESGELITVKNLAKDVVKMMGVGNNVGIYIEIN